MPPIRKYKYGVMKRKKKLNRDVLHKTQVGSLNKCFRKSKGENLVVDETENQFTNDEDTNQNENQNMNENENQDANEENMIEDEDEDDNEIEEDNE